MANQRQYKRGHSGVQYHVYLRLDPCLDQKMMMIAIIIYLYGA